MKSEIGFAIMLLGIALSNGIFTELSGLIVLVGFAKVVLDNLLKKKKNQIDFFFFITKQVAIAFYVGVMYNIFCREEIAQNIEQTGIFF